jgi:threonylcarbamoyladenosine tRNA methylthiotransferase MtaB
MSVETITLGCRLNFAESETIARSGPAGEDWVVVNSCAVTNEAVRRTRQAIRRAHRRRPDARILVTGCAAELDAPSFAQMPGVTRVVGNEAKLVAFSRDVMTPVAAGLMHKVKSFVAVQTGCDHRCTFCSIWQARGPSRSLPFEAIRDAVAKELDRGAKEIVLTGVDITDYEGGLGRLCERLLDEPRLKRLRLSSLDSIEIDEALFELIAGEPRLMPHFHLSLQAGDDMILQRMKRRHSRADAVRAVRRIKDARPDATIGADIIAGFPTETEEMALNSLNLLEDCEIVSAHIFPFSPRPNTPAARMPQVESETVKARAARLRQAAAERRKRWLDSLVGTVQPVLVEGDGTGHTDNFAPISIAGARRGQSGSVRLVALDGHMLRGDWA